MHAHDIGLSWPFAHAEDRLYSCCHVIEQGHPILYVTHDEGDGDWQFLCGQPHVSEEARLVCLGCMIARDKDLLELSDLPPGWGADRESISSLWSREPKSADESD